VVGVGLCRLPRFDRISLRVSRGGRTTGSWDNIAGSILLRFPQLVSWAGTYLSRSPDSRKSAIQTFGYPRNNSPLVLLEWSESVGPALAARIPRSLVRYVPRLPQVWLVPAPQRFPALWLGINPFRFLSFSISVPQRSQSRQLTAPRGLESFSGTGCLRGYASWVRPRMKPPEKQVTEFEAVGVLEKQSHPPSGERRLEPTITSVKTDFLNLRVRA